MDKLELYEVIAGIDGEIVDSALEAERTQKRKRAVKKTRMMTVALIASAFLVAAAAATAIYVNAKNAKVSDSETETYFKPHDNYTDISRVSVGMTYDEALKVLDEGSYAFALGAGLYVNDFKTGHVFNVKFALESWPWVVESITDTGIDVDFIASVEALDRLEKGMSFDEVVQILGRPLYIPTSGVITMLWRIENHESCVCLPFVDGERMIYDGDDKPTVFSMK